jgi:uncharacterized protein
MNTLRVEQLRSNLEQLYKSRSDLLFHGWHHIKFVARKSVEFGAEFNINIELLEAAALTHDLNYIVDVQSEVDDGKELREKVLSEVGFSPDEIAYVEDTVHGSSSEFSGGDISDASKALSDADKLFKVLPVGPMILSSRYITETKVDIQKWADRIVRDQRPLLESGKYFYTQSAKEKYLGWAKLNLDWVEMVRASLDDPDIQSFLEDSKELGYL